MNPVHAVRRLRAVLRLTIGVVCLLAADSALAVPFGSLADWANAPNQTITLDDKDFVWLANSPNWDGSENVNVGFVPAINAHSLGIDQLESYVGPITLSVSYRVDITSSTVFTGVSIDQDFLTSTVTTYKDIFYSLADLQSAAAPGSGTVALSITDFTPNPIPPVPLLPVQSIWVRDTIVLDSSAASVQSISNTFIQQVPEPNSLALAAGGVGLCQFGRWWRRRRRGRSGTTAPAHDFVD